MLIKKVFSSYTFRFLSGYVMGLSIVVLVIQVLIYSAFSYSYFRELGASVNSEMAKLEQAYASGGSEGVDRFVQEKLHPGELNRFFYLLADEEFKKLAGSLDTWPKYRASGEGWLRFQKDIFRWDGEAIDTNFVARSKTLENGYHLLVARHFDDVVNGAKLVGTALIHSMAVTIVLGTIGGALVGLISVKEIDKINRSMQRIMSGDLSERITQAYQRGEVWELSANVNRMLDRIQALMEGVRQVSDNIAHDLRTPLTRLRNRLSDLQTQLAGREEEGDVQTLIDEADAILATFNALLRIARIESGGRREAFAPLELRVILWDVMELYEPLASDKHIRLSCRADRPVEWVGDRDLLFQAIANLIDNAIKYTPAGGEIELALYREGEQVVVAVSDSGCGIPEEDKPEVFRRFYRVEASRSEHVGNGLGLSLVWAVTKLHGGDIQLLDNHPGLRVEMAFPIG